ncbi:MAG: sulfotransferase [Xanthomonadaceae bacterium]|nr:sulfotransferase [Xanthomonadaceae bacterium]MDE1965522.1 sulfotransferase [Xanthomonadaceae bacterium]
MQPDLPDPPLVIDCRRADALLQAGRFAEAADAYRNILVRDPTNADVWYNFGYVLKNLGRFEEALAAYQRALQAGVRDPQEVHLNCAVIYADHLHDEALAEQALRQALTICPTYGPAWLNLGNLHEEHGDRSSAVACYESVLRAGHGADQASRFRAIARMAHLIPPEKIDDPRLVDLRTAAKAAPDPEVQADLWFALGQAYERLAATDPAFDAFARANASCRRQAPAYDPGGHERFTDALIEKCRSPAPSRLPQPGPQPLFICGMYRSGSTLLEQALAAHPLIGSAGELDLLPRMVSGPLAPFPWSLASTGESVLTELACSYLDQLRKLAKDDHRAVFLTDKRPDNFLLIGLIKQMFPQAKILNTVRDPRDNGLSIFMQHLDPRVAPYATDLRDIGHYYNQYLRLMNHWRRLYPEAIHDVDYDALVARPKEVLTEVLDFLGLDWWDGCLRFHERSNRVKTASYWQVRRPLYRDASGRWRRYEAHLGPLRQILEHGNPQL